VFDPHFNADLRHTENILRRQGRHSLANAAHRLRGETLDTRSPLDDIIANIQADQLRMMAFTR